MAYPGADVDVTTFDEVVLPCAEMKPIIVSMVNIDKRVPCTTFLPVVYATYFGLPNICACTSNTCTAVEFGMQRTH